MRQPYKLKLLITGWVNYFSIAKMKTHMSKIDEKIRRNIRIVIWKQWKTTLKRYKSLRQLGASHSLAYQTANCRNRYQFVSVTYGLTTTITNMRLEKRGLVSLLKHYSKVHLVKSSIN